MGAVYRALDTETRGHVALGVFLERFAENARVIELARAWTTTARS
jgi:hypothetical protein